MALAISVRSPERDSIGVQSRVCEHTIWNFPGVFENHLHRRYGLQGWDHTLRGVSATDQTQLQDTEESR